MSNVKTSASQLIGHTPLLEVKNYEAKNGIKDTRILAKLEYFNPAGSVKDRIALAMIEEKDLDADVLLDKVDELLGDDMKLQNMSKAARAMSHPYAARDISELLFKVAGIEHE